MTEQPVEGRPSPVELVRQDRMSMHDIICMVALGWIAIVLVTMALIYFVLLVMYGHAETMVMAERSIIVSVVGLSAMLAPPVLILLATLWIDWLQDG